MISMSDCSVVTSCSAEGWAEYGETFVRSFQKHWPKGVHLYLISEDHLPVPYTRLQESPAAEAFLARHDTPRANGRKRIETDHGWTPKKIAEGYNFRYDAFRFAKKVFAIEIAAQRKRTGKLFWVDADTETFAALPEVLLYDLLPDDAALCCLDRGTYHSECGFVGYNLDHPEGFDFIRAFAALYASDEVFQLQEWHDSWVFDWLRRDLKIPTAPIAHQSRHHPFVNSVLGRFMDHKKGARKLTGTPPSQVLINKDVAYWQR